MPIPTKKRRDQYIISEVLGNGRTQASLAREFGISSNRVFQIVSRARYRKKFFRKAFIRRMKDIGLEEYNAK